MQGSGNISSGHQDLRILVAPVGALILVFTLCYPLTSYLEILPESSASGAFFEESGWHLGLLPLWRYDHYAIARWHPANVLILLVLLSLWGACFYLARRR